MLKTVTRINNIDDENNGRYAKINYSKLKT